LVIDFLQEQPIRPLSLNHPRSLHPELLTALSSNIDISRFRMTDKKEEAIVAPEVAGIEDPQKDVQADHNLEHGLALRDVFKKHKPLVWWCFYWAMAAIGW
jgi:hypothetical protein